MSIQINIPDHILFEDDYIIVLNKPSGLMVEPDRNGHPNLLHQIRKHLKTILPPGEELYAQHIHRLDRPVSGIVLFAKKRMVLKNLNEQFAERRVKKYYQALTDLAPDMRQGKLEHWHRKEKKKAVLYNENMPHAEKAILNYEVEKIAEGRFLWNIELNTGKFHQIRAQLSAAGCPVIGDILYGSDISYKPDSIALHAARLIFYHPVTNEELIIEDKAPFLV
ncbi:MAG: RluA family pseudouridine synthase [Cytophagaceae bacterium]|nr:RluA family pseudouridine synthase [Cytophagaceae bacterium]